MKIKKSRLQRATVCLPFLKYLNSNSRVQPLIRLRVMPIAAWRPLLLKVKDRPLVGQIPCLASLASVRLLPEITKNDILIGHLRRPPGIIILIFDMSVFSIIFFLSRYMQAAEAYAAKSRASRSSTSGGSSGQNGTWSGSKNTWSGSMNGGRGRSRPQLTSDTFRPPSRSSGSRPASRTTSASPGPWRRRQPSGGSGFEDDSLMSTAVPSSTHSTPCKKPVKSAQTKGIIFPKVFS